MELNIRRILVQCEDTFEEGAVRVETPLRKAGVIFVVENPFAGTVGADLAPMIDASVSLGRKVGKKLVEVMGGFEVQGYGKGALGRPCWGAGARQRAADHCLRQSRCARRSAGARRGSLLFPERSPRRERVYRHPG